MLLGSQLRRLREAADISPERAAFKIRASRSKISRIETGKVRFKTRDAADGEFAAEELGFEMTCSH